MVFDKIKDILVDQLEIEPEKITMDASFTEDLGADSLDLVDLVMSLEDEFGMEVPDDAIESLKTVGDAVRYIESHS
ncbi:MAG: acyl carrier protein [Oscillospiraceae bacterium]|nr:acyl carrier protein [Oscillospiraceae bacterium]